MQLDQLFRQIAARLNWTIQDQATVLVALLHDQSTLDIQAISTALTPLSSNGVDVLMQLVLEHANSRRSQDLLAAMDETMPPPVPQQLGPAYHFFANSLTWATAMSPALIALQQGTMIEVEDKRMVLSVPRDQLEMLENVLACDAPLDSAAVDGGILGGFRLQYTQGDCLVLAICNSPTGPYLDAFMVSAVSDTARVVNLAPRRSLLAPMQFAGLPYSIQVEGA